ncbi:aldolase/citrate lyase family protein [Aurantimonas sp. A2-1-M11]|uniref:HpcH/HpaI aldolase family protein n=1 Tax=Aurantimonas sp. A2-1-M11 TaxID=3113712 RepID=UPI002F949145
MRGDNVVLKRKLQGQPVIGTWAQMKSPEFCELATRAGFDFIIIDMEHGSFGIEGAVEMIRAVEANGGVPVVRVPDHTSTNIFKVLDAGAMGVLVPNVSTADQARSIVEAASYGPKGKRGACPCTRGTGHGVDDWRGYLGWTRENVFVSALIETPEGVENFDDIVSVPGINFVTLGPFDLAQALGYEGEYGHPDVQGRLEDLARRAVSKGVGVMAASFESDPKGVRDDFDRWVGHGVNVIVISSDRFFLASGMKSLVNTVRGD